MNRHNSTEKIRVFLLDDHEIVRKGVGQLVNAESDMEVVGESDTATEAIQIISSCLPDVAILDVRLDEGSGIEVCRDIRSAHPEIACLMLSSFSDDQAMIDASLAGASGYLLKKIRSNEIVGSIRKVASGAQLLDSAQVRFCLQKIKETEEGKLNELTPQERRIFDLIGEGFSNRDIAAEMFLAEKTVKNYISNLFSKLGISSRTQAASISARIDERSKRRFE